MKNLKAKNKNSGFVAMFAVLLSMIILAITLGVANVSYKEVMLASSAKEANYAFFAADSGLECGLFVDMKLNALILGGDVDCMGNTYNFVAGNDIPEVTYYIGPSTGIDIVNTSGDGCAIVTVTKHVPNDTTGGLDTIVTSRGYNVPCADVPLSGERTVERLLEATYPEDTP